MSKKITPPPREELEAKYSKPLSTVSGLAKEYGVSNPLMRSWLRKYDIAIKSHKQVSVELGEARKKRVPKDVLERAYREESLGARHTLRIGQQTLYDLLEEYGIPRNDGNDRHRRKKYENWVNRMPRREEVVEAIDELGNLGLAREKLGLSQHSFKKVRDLYGIEAHSVRSVAEQELYSYIRSLDESLEVQHNVRGVLSGNRELDILIPSKNIAVEYCGLYWHSELTGGKDSWYHRRKMEECSSKGIRLITIFESDPIDVVHSALAVKLGYPKLKIGARECQVIQIDKSTARSFHQENHMAGPCGASAHYGMYRDGVLVFVGSFGKSRYHKDSWEIIRMTGLKYTRVQGATSRLIKRFMDDARPGKLMTYADLRYGDGASYSSTMRPVGITPPNYWYFRRGSLDVMSRNMFQKHKIAEKDDMRTEWQIMAENGYDRIWDCGSARFAL